MCSTKCCTDLLPNRSWTNDFALRAWFGGCRQTVADIRKQALPASTFRPRSVLCRRAISSSATGSHRRPCISPTIALSRRDLSEQQRSRAAVVLAMASRSHLADFIADLVFSSFEDPAVAARYVTLSAGRTVT